jgi:hypothetical protein
MCGLMVAARAGSGWAQNVSAEGEAVVAPGAPTLGSYNRLSIDILW